MTEHSNITQFPDRKVSDGGGDGGIDKRLRDLELDVREIKTKLDSVATKEYVLRGVIAGMITAALIALGVARLLD